MSDVVDKKRVGPLSVEVWYDTDSNPRDDWDNATEMFCWMRQSNCGDGKKINHYARPVDFVAAVLEKDVNELEERWYNDDLQDAKGRWVFPLWIYAHGGMTISMGPFGCRWDSGQVGYISITEKSLKDCMGETKFDEATAEERREHARKVCEGEVKDYDDCLQGNIYGFTVYDEDRNTLESCGGFYGDSDEAFKEGVSIAESELEYRAKKKAEEQLRIDKLSAGFGQWVEETRYAVQPA